MKYVVDVQLAQTNDAVVNAQIAINAFIILLLRKV